MLSEELQEVQQANPGPDGSICDLAGACRRTLRQECGHRRLTYWPQLGVGYYPVEEAPYDDDYFDKYTRYADTIMGRDINTARLDLVASFYHGDLVDYGIGCGSFIQARIRRYPYERTLGYDVNPKGIDWLKSHQLWWQNDQPVDAMSMWDVLEHIENFDNVLARVRKYFFVSLPIFRDAEHILSSKHYRTDEHCWYFTERGLITVMGWLGFDCYNVNNSETILGREDIKSFAFRRVD